jgi:hypothetical protein
MSERLDVSLPLMKMNPNEQVKETQRLTQVAAGLLAPPDSSPTLPGSRLSLSGGPLHPDRSASQTWILPQSAIVLDLSRTNEALVILPASSLSFVLRNECCQYQTFLTSHLLVSLGPNTFLVSCSEFSCSFIVLVFARIELLTRGVYLKACPLRSVRCPNVDIVQRCSISGRSTFMA